MSVASQLVAGSLVLAVAYALIGTAWAIIFRTSNTFNFATGQFVVLGSLIYYTFSTSLRIPVWLALPLSLVAIVVFAVGIYAVFVRPITGQPIFAAAILTLGLSIILTSFTQIVWGHELRVLAAPFRSETYRLAGVLNITNYQAATILGGLVFFAALLVLFRYSRIGIQMRATAENPLLASQVGINVHWMMAVAWSLAFVAASLAGIGYAYANVLSQSSSELGLRGIAPLVLGGLERIDGVIVGAILIAVTENLAVLYLGGTARDAVAWFVILLALAVRPQGLFGQAEVRRV